MQTADQNKKDSKKAETLAKQGAVLVGKLGPEYNKLMDGLDGVDPNSNEGKEFDSILSGLDLLQINSQSALHAKSVALRQQSG
jgi:hypothetical protein